MDSRFQWKEKKKDNEKVVLMRFISVNCEDGDHDDCCGEVHIDEGNGYSYSVNCDCDCHYEDWKSGSNGM